MRLIYFILFIFLYFRLIQVKAQNRSDTLTSIEKRLTNNENVVSKLNKIKLSGYLQVQWVNYEASSVYPNNFFSIRRARLKFTYNPSSWIMFVLQPDFVPGNITIKDAYIFVKPKNLNTFSLYVGKFNRPNLAQS